MNLLKFQNKFLGIVACLLFICSFIKLSLVIFIIKITYFVECESIIPLIYNHCDRNIEHEDCYVQDQDIDNSYWANILNEEIYLIYRCRFLFDYYSGDTTLSLEDYHSLVNFFNNIYITSDYWSSNQIKQDNFILSYKIKLHGQLLLKKKYIYLKKKN